MPPLLTPRGREETKLDHRDAATLSAPTFPCRRRTLMVMLVVTHVCMSACLMSSHGPKLAGESRRMTRTAGSCHKLRVKGDG